MKQYLKRYAQNFDYPLFFYGPIVKSLWISDDL